MQRILSTGTAFTIATTTGDAGQLGMVAEFSGYFSGLISRLICPMIGGGALGDRCEADLSPGKALWNDLVLWFWPFLGLAGWFGLGDGLGKPDFDDCARRRYLHYFSQHSVFQH
ncbi:hypothetical protein [Nodosilinea nodulosa]|uniref:hypothetical protein n=1 Tax=Nodosilinea nodulosa TaxID=416001 RepID=UPI0002DE3CCD|nr:hypothetical protein [Nodosilinea nodulosa]